MKEIEILAPCGNYDSLIAAVRSGADAVYLGTGKFNARRNAGNFDFEELKNAVSYCHARNVKVHVAFNTLVMDDEVPMAVETLKHICLSGADVLILQDLGLASIVKKYAPEIERHASTQMSVQTPDGVNLLESMGYTRAVLPREMSKKEICYVRKNTNIELESFVHGALCMCVSGQCLLSAMLGSRSGNRGLCAQPCRLPFKSKNGTGYDLSLKDLSLIKYANELQEIGIASLKIEGRMKRPEYVAAAVKSLKNKLENVIDEDIDKSLEAVFSRSGFTQGYYESKLGPSMFGIRRKEDVVSADKNTFSKLAEIYKNEIACRKVDFYITALEGEKVSLRAESCGEKVEVILDYYPQKAINKATDRDSIIQRLSKCGGTIFYPGNIDVELDDNIFVQASAINELRRNALVQLEEIFSTIKSKPFYDAKYFPKAKTLKEKQKTSLGYIVRVSNLDQLPNNKKDINAIIVPLGSEVEALKYASGTNIRVICEIPAGIFSTDNIILKKLISAKENGINEAYCNTLDGIAIAKKAEIKIFGGFRLNVFNSYSVDALEEMGLEDITLSPELKLNTIAAIKSNISTSIIAYGRLPLMLTRNCPNKNGMDCSKCNGQGILVDRKGIEFPIACNNGCSELLNSKVIYLGDKIDDIKTDNIIFYFTKEGAGESDTIIDLYRNKEKYYTDYTRGLYYRGVE